MPCAFSLELLRKVAVFHGHECPGLTIGIRAAELALRELGGPGPDLVAVSETDMCGVDAIQVLTGCTYGKGNLIHRDLGKMAFSFYRRGAGGFRAVLRPEARGGMDEEMGALFRKQSDGAATPEEEVRARVLREELRRRFLDLELEEMFTITPLPERPPRPARVLRSLACDSCGEMTMESRTRRFDGQTLCISCFEAVEQKI
ncbi:FmdE family protein [Desulfovibrio aminophilus]|uniref:FmdE family protein n=1 Tax=Desulfovibrio aminophilus TaxID=81425 RepID=UPI00041FDB0B|nr:FmdE family protein [Desulfovibrio aminophilus]